MWPSVIKVSHFALYRHDWPWIHFEPEEMADDDTGVLIVVPAFMDWLEEVRTAFDRRMILNDATRTPARQQRHSGRITGSHVDGMAVDVRVHGEDADGWSASLSRKACSAAVFIRAARRRSGSAFCTWTVGRRRRLASGPRLWSG